MRRTTFAILSISLSLSACTSRPRSFEPVLAASPSSQADYDRALLACRQQLAASMDKSGRLASAAGGVAVGAGGGLAAGAATASATTGMMGASAAIAAATVIAAPLVAITGAWGIAKAKRNKKERAIKAAMRDCLAAKGYSVARWDALSKREARAMAVDIRAPDR